MSDSLGFITSEPARRNGPRESRKFNNDDAQLRSACAKLEELINTLESDLSTAKISIKNSTVDAISDVESVKIFVTTRSRN